MLVRTLRQGRVNNMTVEEKEVCPTCNSNSCEAFYVSSPEGYTSLVVRGFGSIGCLYMCTSCGTVFLSRDYRLKLLKWRKERERK